MSALGYIVADLGYRLLWPMSAIIYYGRCGLLSPMWAVVADVGFCCADQRAVMLAIVACVYYHIYLHCRCRYIADAGAPYALLI
jgi:hypothetical protein